MNKSGIELMGESAVAKADDVKIDGGKIYAKVGGDGLDSNSAGIISGGYIEVYGPENSGNSTMDFDGGYEINGGTVVAAGSTGMAESPSETSKQNSYVKRLSKNYEAGSEICLTDENGGVIASGISEKRFSWVLISSDGNYTLSINGEAVE